VIAAIVQLAEAPGVGGLADLTVEATNTGTSILAAIPSASETSLRKGGRLDPKAKIREYRCVPEGERPRE
jgi:hypothetical protein